MALVDLIFPNDRRLQVPSITNMLDKPVAELQGIREIYGPDQRKAVDKMAYSLSARRQAMYENAGAALVYLGH